MAVSGEFSNVPTVVENIYPEIPLPVLGSNSPLFSESDESSQLDFNSDFFTDVRNRLTTMYEKRLQPDRRCNTKTPDSLPSDSEICAVYSILSHRYVRTQNGKSELQYKIWWDGFLSCEATYVRAQDLISDNSKGIADSSLIIHEYKLYCKRKTLARKQGKSLKEKPPLARGAGAGRNRFVKISANAKLSSNKSAPQWPPVCTNFKVQSYSQTVDNYFAICPYYKDDIGHFSINKGLQRVSPFSMDVLGFYFIYKLWNLEPNWGQTILVYPQILGTTGGICDTAIIKSGISLLGYDDAMSFMYSGTTNVLSIKRNLYRLFSKNKSRPLTLILVASPPFRWIGFLHMTVLMITPTNEFIVFEPSITLPEKHYPCNVINLLRNTFNRNPIYYIQDPDFSGDKKCYKNCFKFMASILDGKKTISSYKLQTYHKNSFK